MQKVSILIFILIISALTSLNTEIFFSSAIDDNGFDSIAPNYDYRATGFNPQTQINKDNVKNLELKWVHAWPLPESIDGIEPRVGSIANSIIVDGIVYNRMEDLRISAIDAKTGKDIWSFQADPYLVNIEIAKRDLPVNLDFYPSLSSHAHSFSFAENKIFAPWPNCQVFGLNAKTGEIEFKLKTPTCKGLEGNEGLFKGLQSSGPVFDTVNRVLIYGTGGREAVEGGRGAFRGYSLDSGELLWTFYLMPPQDVGDPEWTVRVADKGWIQGIKASDIPEDILRNDWGECPDNCGFGKGDMGIGWGQWAVDEDNGIAYLATGNPSPSWNATYRPGPNVFSNSVLAIETKTGNLLWWHQIVAHDLGDLDCSWNTVLADIDGVKTVFKLCKGAFLYAMNAETGELLWSTDYHPHVKRGEIGPDPNFDFALDPLNKDDMNKPWVSYPGNEANWRKESGGAESDVTFAYGKIFSTTYHKWSLQKITSVEPSMRDAWGRISIYSDKELAANATVWAHDAKTGEMIWKYDMEKVGIRGGVTASGEMIWFCDTDGMIRALDEENGKLLWERSQGHQCPVQPSFGADKDGNIKIFSLIGSGGILGRSEPIPGALLAYGLSGNIETNEGKSVEVTVETEVITEEIISPVSYLILGFSLILIITSLLIFRKSRS